MNDALVGLGRTIRRCGGAEPRQGDPPAIEEAREGDIVILAGKGHETYQVLKDGVSTSTTRGGEPSASFLRLRPGACMKFALAEIAAALDSPVRIPARFRAIASIRAPPAGRAFHRPCAAPTTTGMITLPKP